MTNRNSFPSSLTRKSQLTFVDTKMVTLCKELRVVKDLSDDIKFALYTILSKNLSIKSGSN